MNISNLASANLEYYEHYKAGLVLALHSGQLLWGRNSLIIIFKILVMCCHLSNSCWLGQRFGWEFYLAR